MNIASRDEMTRPKRKSSAFFPSLLAAVLIGACAGCCHVRTDFVPVREAIYRTEISRTNRLALPLSEGDREFLLTFLKSGRNPALDSDGTIADPGAPQRYGGLIELLRSPEQLWVTNLVANERFVPTAVYRHWFPHAAVRQVVDAHEEWPHQPPPYAFLDSTGENWWVFYHERKRLLHLMVTRAMAPAKPK